MSTTQAPSTGSTTSVETAKKRRRRGLSILSKLLIMLLVTSLASAIVVGIIAYFNGRDSLTAAAYDELTAIRESRAEELGRQLDTFEAGVTIAAANASAEIASVEFNAAFAQLDEQPVSDADRDAVTAFYTDTFIPLLEERSSRTFSADALIPASNAGVYLQARYTVPTDPYTDQGAAAAVEDAGDGSAWSAVHARFHDYFKRLVDNLGYVDVLLVDDDGNVVYTVDKGIDLGTNLRSGPYERTALGEAYRDAMASGSSGSPTTTDFEPYVPSLDAPTAWAVMPVGDAGDITGALAVQVPIETIDDVMTGGENWAAQGLGETGEVYLVGGDGLMRSNSRPLIEDPDTYAERVIDNGTPERVAEAVVAAGSTVLLQPADSPAVRAAIAGERGVMVSREYIGGDSLTAFAPLDFTDVDWVIVARMETSEAFAPVNDFSRTLVIWTVGIALFVTLLSLLLAQLFTRPIRTLSEAAHRIGAGDLGARVPVTTRDEFGDLGTAFNDMSRSLRVKQELIDQQRSEYDDLLLTLMPASVAQRFRKGEDAIAEEHQDVSVVYAEIVGYDDYAADLGGEQSLAGLATLMSAFDEAAQRTGVEKVRPLREGYLASSGLVVPRIDNIRRAVDFAVELDAAVARFNTQNDTTLALRTGVATGTVTAGLLGRTSLAYDLWGDAVNLAHRVRGVSTEPGIFVSQGVRDGVGGALSFTEAGRVTAKDGEQIVWRVAEES